MKAPDIVLDGLGSEVTTSPEPEKRRAIERPFIKTTVPIIGTVIAFTAAISMLIGRLPVREGAFIGLAATVLAIIAAVKGDDGTESIKKLMTWAIVVLSILILIRTFYPGWSLKELDVTKKRASSQITFTGNYTIDKAYDKEHGLIKTILIGTDNVKVGDRFEIIAKLSDGRMFSGEEIAVWLGGKWMPTKNGYFSKTIESLTPGHIIVSLGGRTDVKFTVEVTRP